MLPISRQASGPSWTVGDFAISIKNAREPKIMASDSASVEIDSDAEIEVF